MKQQPEIKVQEVPTSDLLPYANNAKIHTREQIDQICASIEEFGFNDPVAVWHNQGGQMEIIEGHGRVMAAKKLGIQIMPVIYLDHLSDEQRRAYTHVHNQLTMNTDFDFDMLAMDMNDMPDFQWDDFGFEMPFGDLTDESDVKEDSFDPDTANVEPRCQPGDKRILGNHVLVCGDSTKRESWDMLLDGEQVDLMVTDPPYNVAYEGKTADALTIENDSLAEAEFRSLLEGFMERAEENMRPGAAFYVWHASRTQREFEDSINHAGMTVRQQIIWNKNAMTLGRQDYQWKHEPCFYGWKEGAAHHFVDDRTQTTVWDFDKPSRSELHPTMKPVALIAKCVTNSSRKCGIVADPFGGSGSTLIACEETGRKCRTIELDPRYCDTIIARWEDLTGEVAHRA